MKRTEILQEIRRMRFEELYGGWQKGRLSQEEAAQILLGYAIGPFGDRFAGMKRPGLRGSMINTLPKPHIGARRWMKNINVHTYLGHC